MPGQNTCACGCGTEIPETNKLGQPQRFAHGHNRYRPLEDRFWEKVDKGGPNGCWLWTAQLSNEGYGKFRASREEPVVFAHRQAYLLIVGHIPEGLELDHLCRNPQCCNPDHLEPVTHAENMARYARSNTHCRHGHEWTPENTYISPSSGHRCCRACNRNKYRRRVGLPVE